MSLSWPSESTAMPTCRSRSPIVRCWAFVLCRGKVEFWAWPVDILGKNVICKENKHSSYLCVYILHVCVFMRLSPAGPGCLKVMPSPCEASWRAASADGCCCCCCCRCTVCLAHASPTAGHWLSGTAMPHLLEPANTNTADAPVSQCQSRERFGEAGDKRAASRQVLVGVIFFSPSEEKDRGSIMEEE